MQYLIRASEWMKLLQPWWANCFGKMVNWHFAIFRSWSDVSLMAYGHCLVLDHVVELLSDPLSFVDVDISVPLSFVVAEIIFVSTFTFSVVYFYIWCLECCAVWLGLDSNI